MRTGAPHVYAVHMMRTQRVQLADETGYVNPRGIVHLRENGKILCGAMVPDAYRLAFAEGKATCVQCWEVGQGVKPQSTVPDRVKLRTPRGFGTVIHYLASKGGETICGIVEACGIHLSIVDGDPTCINCITGCKSSKPMNVTVDAPAARGRIVHSRLPDGSETSCGLVETDRVRFVPVTADTSCQRCLMICMGC